MLCVEALRAVLLEDRTPANAVVADRRAAVAPRPRPLELRGDAEQRRLVGRPADQLDADRQAVVAPGERHRDGRLAGDVRDRRERRERGRVAELIPRIVVGERADRAPAAGRASA